MGKYRITAPDGNTYEVTAPEGVTQEEVMAYAKSNYQGAAQQSLGKAPPSPVAELQPKKGVLRTVAENLLTPAGANLLDSTQHHALNPLHGLAQTVEHGASSLINALLPEGNAIRQYANKTVAQDDAAMKQREAEYQARVPNGVMSTIGAGVGEIAPWMYGIGALRAAGILPKLAPVSQVAGVGAKAGNLAAKAGLLSAEGAAMAAAQPVLGDNFGREKAAQVAIGAVTAPALGAAVGSVGGLSRKALDYVTPSGREVLAGKRLAEAFGGDEATLAELRRKSEIPGFELTPAQALATPEAVQAERVLRNNAVTAPAFAKAASVQNAALRNVVSSLAKDDSAMAAARAARSNATSPFYEALPGKQVPVADVLAQIDSLSNSNLGVRPKIKTAINSLRSEINNRANNGTIDAGILSGIRENVGSFLGDMPSSQEIKALAPIADTIASEIDRAVPGYRNNLAAYASTSQPINDMQAARSLLDAIDSGRRDAGGNQAFDLTKVRSLLAKDDRANFPMSPEARKSLVDVMRAIQQRGVADNTIAASGPGTAADAMRGGPSWMTRAIGQGAGATGAVVGSHVSPGVGTLLGYLLGTGAAEGITAANNSVLRQVGQKGASAPATADAIEAYLQRQSSSTPYGWTSPLLPYTVQQRP